MLPGVRYWVSVDLNWITTNAPMGPGKLHGFVINIKMHPIRKGYYSGSSTIRHFHDEDSNAKSLIAQEEHLAASPNP